MKPNHHNRYRALFALAATVIATTTVHAQLDGSNGINMGGDSSTGRIAFAETITDISGSPATFPQGWTTPFLDIANIIAPVSQFTGVNNDGSLVDPLDLIPLKPSSITLGPTTITSWDQVAKKVEYAVILGSGMNGVGDTAVTANISAYGASAYSSPSASITYTANSITLKTGKTYRVVVAITNFNSPLKPFGVGYFGLYDNATNTALGDSIATGSGDVNKGITQPSIEYIVAPTADTTYSVRVKSEVAGVMHFSATRVVVQEL